MNCDSVYQRFPSAVISSHCVACERLWPTSSDNHTLGWLAWKQAKFTHMENTRKGLLQWCLLDRREYQKVTESETDRRHLTILNLCKKNCWARTAHWNYLWLVKKGGRSFFCIWSWIYIVVESETFGIASCMKWKGFQKFVKIKFLCVIVWWWWKRYKTLSMAFIRNIGWVASSIFVLV